MRAAPETSSAAPSPEAPSEQSREDVFTSAGPHVLVGIAEIETAEDVLLAVLFMESAGAEGIVLFFLLGVREYGVGLVDFLELVFGCLVIRVTVGVIFDRQFAKGFFYLLG